MDGEDGFSLVVRTSETGDGLRTEEASEIRHSSDYALTKLAEALYVSAEACIDRQARTASDRRHEGCYSR